jgi:predicted nucleotidyltransferase
MEELRSGNSSPRFDIAARSAKTGKTKVKPISPTPYPGVNEILSFMFAYVQEILGNQFVGMYLFGSLANGGFDEHSDIDVLIVTDGELSAGTFSALQQLHQRINGLDSPWANQIEASYIPERALRRFDPWNKLHPHMDRGNGEVLHMMSHESDWIIQRHILRERGIVIAGPDLQTLIDPVSSDELRQAVADVLPLWSDPILKNPSLINKRGYQSYCVLTLCRMYYTLRYGELLPKALAAKWALENLDARWGPLIERALIGRQNGDWDADPKDIDETVEMMQYVLAQTQPTPYSEVNDVLNRLLFHVKRILGDQFVGMYLYGSLASGDFDPETSDIDFLVVASETLPDETIADLEAMHQETWATSLKRSSQLEGAYVPRELIWRHNPNGAACPTVNEGRFYLARLGSDWIIQRHVVREHGVTVEGPDPKTLIDFVSPDDIRGAVLGILREWWFPMLEDPSWLREHGSKYHAFAVISMCRVLHALEHGTVVSKPKAVAWARAKLDTRWLPLLDKALAASRHATHEDFLGETLDFIRFVKEQTRKFEKQIPETGIMADENHQQVK